MFDSAYPYSDFVFMVAHGTIGGVFCALVKLFLVYIS